MYTQRTPLPIGTLITENETVQYKVLSILGCGGNAICYKVISSDEQYYVLKEVYPTEIENFLMREETGKIILTPIFKTKELEETWEWHKNNLKNEVSNQIFISRDSDAKAQDPFFLKSYGTFVSTNGNLYARFDMQKGRTLSQALNDDSLSPDQLISIMMTACKKLACLHTVKGMLHLDLSPMNLYIINHSGLGEEAYFLDFGTAKKISDADQFYRYSATLGFSSQEVRAKSEGNHSSIYKINPSCDTYSMVAILFYGLIGDIFSVDYRLNPSLWMCKLRQNLQNFGFEDATDRLANILTKGLSDRNTRYQTADELFTDLNDVYQHVTVPNKQMSLLLNDIEDRLGRFEQTLSKKIASTGEKIEETVKSTGRNIEKTITSENKKHQRMFTLIFASVFACFIVVVIIWAKFNKAQESETDLEPPKIMLTNCPQEQGGYIITGNYFEACLKISDNKELKWYNLTNQDIVCKGFEGQVHTEFLADGIYSLKISDIKNKSDNARIVIKESCAIDASNNVTEEISLPIKFVTVVIDSTSPSMLFSRINNNDRVQTGSDAIFYMVLGDETDQNLIVNISEQYIIACGFEYEDFSAVRIDSSNQYSKQYKITFSNVQGTNGKKQIYIARGAGIDQSNNYSESYQISFILYDDEKNIDTTPPEIILSAPKITDTSVEYLYEFHDNVDIVSFDFDEQDITTIGFSATMEIDWAKKVIRFENIKNTSDSNEKYIIINSGILTDAFNNRSNAVISPCFILPE